VNAQDVSKEETRTDTKMNESNLDPFFLIVLLVIGVLLSDDA